MTDLEKAQAVLDEAKELISGPRREAYGGPRESLSLVAEFWNMYIYGRTGQGSRLSGRDVANMMVLFKITRDSHAPKHDNLVDICGYGALAGVFGEPVEEE